MKALLILVGGRPIPNILTVIHEKPDVIVAVCSKESIEEEWLQLKPAIEKFLPSVTIKEKEPIDAYDVDAIKNTCERALLEHPDAEWVLNITGGTSLMTHGTYIAAEYCSKQRGISVRCWFLDTGHVRVISLLGKKRDASIFYLSVEQYIAAHNYNLKDSGNTVNCRVVCQQEDWLAFAYRLGKNPLEVNLLKQILKDYNDKTRKTLKDDKKFQFLQELQKLGMVSKLREEEGYLHFFLSDKQRKFLDGAWLELYVLQDAQNTGFFDDSLWSKEIVDNDPKRAAKNPFIFKEMDVSLTYKAQLMIVECKTGDEGSKTKTLDDLVTVADLVGKGAVFKVLVTSQAEQENKSEEFQAKARSKSVRVIMQEELPQVGTILTELIQKAKHR